MAQRSHAHAVKPEAESQGHIGPEPIEPKAINFFQTLPGVLTAMAGVITAIGGLIVGLHQTGYLGKQSDHAQVQQATTTSGTTLGPSGATAATPGVTLPPPTNSNATKSSDGSNSTGTAISSLAQVKSFPVALATGGDISFTRSDYVLRILFAKAEQNGDGSYVFTWRVRATNNARGFNYVSRDAFRMVADGVPLAPTNSPDNISTPAESAAEGTFIFAVPAGTTSTELRIHIGEQIVNVPIRVVGK